jgi:type II secretory pathway pseudopilin PulG
LIEILVVIGIIGAVTGVSVPMYYRYMQVSELDNATSVLMQQLGRAKTLAQSGENAAPWGVSVDQGAITLFEGASYAARDSAWDEVYPLPDTITFGGLPEVTFSRVDGVPSVTGEMTLLNITGDQREVEITLNMEGIQTNDNDTITICHKPGEENETKTINDNAWPGHRGHGDTLGVCSCEGDEEGCGEEEEKFSSASAASSVSSSTSSSGEGSGGSSGKMDICHNNHTINVSVSACNAHMGHGDTVGTCPGSGTTCPN